MTDTWVTDLRHFLRDDGDVLWSPGKGLADHLCQIVASVTQQATDLPCVTDVVCRRRPKRQRCAGKIQGVFEGPGNSIRWLCPNCGDTGWISGWQGTHWDKGARPRLPSIPRIAYRGGLIRNRRESATLPVIHLQAPAIPHALVVAIHDNDLIGISGEFGNPALGEPMQYDELTIDHAGGSYTMIVFNRAIMLFGSREEFFVRFHRVVCIIEGITRPNKPLNPSGAKDAPAG